MQAVSGINQALAIRNAPQQLATEVAVARKGLEATEKVGSAVVQLLEQANQAGRTVDYKA